MSLSSDSLVATNHLRDKLRRYCKMEREYKRNSESDSLRLGLGEIRSMITELENLTEKDVTGLCSRIKRRKHATSEDMFRLSHAFLQSNDNIVAFAKIPGAINVIVKELTGHDSESQIKASETLCNLSLGDAVVCEKIATFAGSYLVTYFYSTENRLKRTSLWVIMNIAASGGKGLGILISQEIIPKLVSFYCNEKDLDILNDVAICLDLVVSSKNVNLRTEDIYALRQIIFSKLFDSPIIQYHLKMCFQLISNANAKESSLNGDELRYLTSTCLVILENTNNIQSIDNYQKVLYSIRLLSNLCAKYSIMVNLIEEAFENHETEFYEILNKIFEWDNNELIKETIWFMKNVLSSEEFKNKDIIIKNLKIKRSSVLTMKQ